MSFDSSRFTFDPHHDFSGVVMQQGRVQLDSEWNEWLAEFSRRIQAETLDIFGHAAVPARTHDGFHIHKCEADAGNISISIGPGRMYVDGLLAENHGFPAPPAGWIPTSCTAPSSGSREIPVFRWDGALDELNGAARIRYDCQPYFPNAGEFMPFPQLGGPYLVYLDVWQREITFLEDPDLIEKAVGVDTTGRIQTVWQVKWLPIGCTSESEGSSDAPTWDSLLWPPGARLTNGVGPVPAPRPGTVTQNAGYTGQENQLYRVEIHQGGDLSQATFKWSRDNGSVATEVSGIAQAGLVLTVQSTGRDSVLRFNANDWVEIKDDWLELSGQPGELHQIASVSDAQRTITLMSPVSSASFPVDTNGQTHPGRHTRLQRWDQTQTSANGDIAMPAPGMPAALENGITVTFDLLTGERPFSTGDNWVFAARATDGTIESLQSVPPRGINHHYAKLSIVELCSERLPHQAGEWATLRDNSPEPAAFLSFRTADPKEWATSFGVSARANATNPANFDLEVVYNPDSVVGVTPPVTLETFTNLSLAADDPSYAPSIINATSRLIKVRSAFTPLAQAPVFAKAFSTNPPNFSAAGTLSLTDASPAKVVFLTVTQHLPASWSKYFAVSASPGETSDRFNLAVVYAPLGSNDFAIVEQFENLTPKESSLHHVTSNFITHLRAGEDVLDPPQPLHLVALSDCRTIWRPSSGPSWCTESIAPGDDDSANIQAVLDRYTYSERKTTIFLEPGIYRLDRPVRLTQEHRSITIQAAQPGSVEICAIGEHHASHARFEQGLLILDHSQDISLVGLNFVVPSVPHPSTTGTFAGVKLSESTPYLKDNLAATNVCIGIRPVGCIGLTVDRCAFDFPDSPGSDAAAQFGAAIFAAGHSHGLTVTGCRFTANSDYVSAYLHTTCVAFRPSETEGEMIEIKPWSISSHELLSLSSRGADVVAATLSGARFENNTYAGRMGSAVLHVGEATDVSLVSNRHQASRSGFWLVSHHESIRLYLLDRTTLLTVLMAQAYPLPRSDVRIAITVAPAAAPVLLYVGKETFTDSRRRVWQSDTTENKAIKITGTTRVNTIVDALKAIEGDLESIIDRALYEIERVGPHFTYTFSELPTGVFTVKLRFAVISDLSEFDVLINGRRVLAGFDVYREAKRLNRKGVDKVFTGVPSKDGQITIEFRAAAQSAKQLATISAIEVIPPLGGEVTAEDVTRHLERQFAGLGDLDALLKYKTDTGIASDITIFFYHLQRSGSYAYAGQEDRPNRFRIQDNDMSLLKSQGVVILGKDSTVQKKASTLIMSGNYVHGETDSGLPRLVPLGLILSVAQCVVHSNVILNEKGDEKDQPGRSFILNNSALPDSKLVVNDNIHQGLWQVLPKQDVISEDLSTVRRVLGRTDTQPPSDDLGEVEKDLGDVASVVNLVDPSVGSEISIVSRVVQWFGQLFGRGR